jgi:hypothetical protein
LLLRDPDTSRAVVDHGFPGIEVIGRLDLEGWDLGDTAVRAKQVAAHADLVRVELVGVLDAADAVEVELELRVPRLGRIVLWVVRLGLLALDLRLVELALDRGEVVLLARRHRALELGA